MSEAIVYIPLSLVLRNDGNLFRSYLCSAVSLSTKNDIQKA